MEEAHPEGIQDRDANPSPHVVDDTPPPLAWASVLWPDRSYLVRSMVVLELAERGPPLGASTRGCEDGLRRGLGGWRFLRSAGRPAVVSIAPTFEAVAVLAGRSTGAATGTAGAGGAAEDLAGLGAA